MSHTSCWLSRILGTLLSLGCSSLCRWQFGSASSRRDIAYSLHKSHKHSNYPLASQVDKMCTHWHPNKSPITCHWYIFRNGSYLRLEQHTAVICPCCIKHCSTMYSCRWRWGHRAFDTWFGSISPWKSLR